MVEETVTEAVTDASDNTATTTTITAIQEQVEKTTSILERAADRFKSALPALLMAMTLLIVGIITVKVIMRIVKRTMKRSNIDNAAKSFLLSLIKIILYVNVMIMVLSALKVPMSSIITIFGAAGLAISLALQNCLSNLAGGFIILFSKPFVAGDLLEVDGSLGRVESISILYTKLITFDNKTVFIPNGKVADGKIVNFTSSPVIRVDMKFSISYSADYGKARELILKAIEENKMILKNPASIVRMSSHNESSISIDVLVWTNNADYFTVRYDMIETVKRVFDENGIEIPFNQLDVYVKEQIKEQN